MFPYDLEHVCSYTVAIANPPEVIGPVAEGVRVNAYVAGGEVSGPRLRGRIRPVGADWLTIRSDGVAVLDVRGTMETHDGALVYIYYTGIGDLGEEGHTSFLRGEMPEALALRTAPRLQSAHPDYRWVNRLQFLGVGEADFRKGVVAYDLYGVV